jgi:hypothetical protein
MRPTAATGLLPQCSSSCGRATVRLPARWIASGASPRLQVRSWPLDAWIHHLAAGWGRCACGSGVVLGFRASSRWGIYLVVAWVVRWPGAADPFLPLIFEGSKRYNSRCCATGSDWVLARDLWVVG